MRACASFRVRPDETPPLGSYGRGEEEEESKRKVKGFHYCVLHECTNTLILLTAAPKYFTLADRHPGKTSVQL